MEGLIFGLAYLWGEIWVSKIDWASLIVGRKFTVFALFYFVFEGNFQVQAPWGGGGLYLEGLFNGEFFALWLWVAYMSRGFYVEGLIFGILWCVATDIKMLRSKFLAKKVSAKFAYQNRSCLPYITPQYLHICDIFTMSKFVQIHFLYSRKVQMPLSWKPMFCLYTSCSNIFSKSCLKVALALVNMLPSFLHIWQGFQLPLTTSRLQS